MASHASFSSFYQKQFLPTYLRMRTTLRKEDPPPQAIVEGIIDSFTHLSHSYDLGLTPEDQAKYISLGLDALIETLYLCYEIIAISIDTEISAVCNDPRKAKCCINMDYSDFKKEHRRFKKAGFDARNSTRMKSDEIGENLLNKIDWVKIEDFERESKQEAAISALQEENLSAKDKVIELLSTQISQHPKRSFAMVVVLFIISGFFNTVLRDFFDQILIPHIGQYIKDIGINLTAFYP